MKPLEDPFVPMESTSQDGEGLDVDFSHLSRRPLTGADAAASTRPARVPVMAPLLAPVVGRFEGFDLLDQPLVTGVPTLPGEILTARSAIALRSAQIGQAVVLLFENGDARLPLIMGVLGAAAEECMDAPAVHADGMRQVIEAERELVLKCGEASITLTRAGRVIIKGRYVLSRSSGVNKIKGATVDIN